MLGCWFVLSSRCLALCGEFGHAVLLFVVIFVSLWTLVRFDHVIG